MTRIHPRNRDTCSRRHGAERARRRSSTVAYNLPDFPITAIVRDDVTGDLYASSDFGVMKLPNGAAAWVAAGTGMPMVEVSGLTIIPSARILYAATHGRSAWSMQLP